jgi:predicted ABC-type ATPase
MAKESNKPLLVMFAGPNGSGKSTITPIFQSQTDFPQNYINPDEIAITLGGNTIFKAYEASAIAAKERLKCIESKQSFSFETVMSHPSKLAILETAIEAGFETRLVFVSTNNPLTNVDRVKQRVIEGGHDVPEDKVISRYHRSLSLLPKALEIVDKTYIFDNSDSSKLELVLSQGKVIEKSGSTIEWVEKTVAILDERGQEKLAIKQRNPEFSFARLDRDEHIGVIESVGKHFSVQQMKDGQTIIHENSILNLDSSAIGQNISVIYYNGVHKVNPTEEIQQARVEKIAPILMNYLDHNQTLQVESTKSFIQFNRETKTLTYEDKIDKNEYLSARYETSKWLDQGSNITLNKEEYFTQTAATQIARRQASQNQNDVNQSSRKLT